ncbi:MAG: RNA polymerase sigma factor [Steroidobacteraceae bacterium]
MGFRCAAGLRAGRGCRRPALNSNPFPLTCIQSSDWEKNDTEPEELLIAQAAKGDQRAFERLYRAHVDRVHGLCLRMMRNVASAEDCTQQAFIQAWTALPRFELRSSFATWLHRIAVNVVLGQRRSRWDELPPTAQELDSVPITFDTPMEVAEIEAAIESLPEGARDVLILSGIYGHTHAEVAQMLGVAEGTCKAQLHRARQLLRARLSLEAMS